MDIDPPDIPAVISTILPLALVLMVVTNIITEVLKGLTWGKRPTNILAFFAACQIMGIRIVWYMIVGAVVLGIFVAYAAMFGFDKLRQTMEQIKGIKNN